MIKILSQIDLQEYFQVEIVLTVPRASLTRIIDEQRQRLIKVSLMSSTFDKLRFVALSQKMDANHFLE